MHTRRILLVFTMIFLCSALFAPAVRADYDTVYFREQLAPYGRWIERPDYGWVWTPTLVPVYWKPYTTGHWEMTVDGMLWVADEPWGWIPFHYGRWSYDAFVGWFWVPGEVWAPAWVAWREGGGYTGWAPLPPFFIWEIGIGFRRGNFGFDDIDDDYWVFVPERDLMEREVSQRAEHRARGREFKAMTRNITRFEERDGRPVNRSIEADTLEKWIGRPVRREKISDLDAPVNNRGIITEGDSVRVFRQRVKRSPSFWPEGGFGAPPEAPREPERPRVIENRQNQPGGMEDRQREPRPMEGSRGPSQEEQMLLRQRQEAEHRQLEERQRQQNTGDMPEQQRMERYYQQQRERNYMEDQHDRDNRMMQNRGGRD
jgi:hypothetical protein